MALSSQSFSILIDLIILLFALPHQYPFSTYGEVIQCLHKPSGLIVAIKKFKRTEEEDRTSLREVTILKVCYTLLINYINNSTQIRVTNTGTKYFSTREIYLAKNLEKIGSATTIASTAAQNVITTASIEDINREDLDNIDEDLDALYEFSMDFQDLRDRFINQEVSKQDEESIRSFLEQINRKS